jgi:F-type H+-transporting ATPase subunit delta
MKINKEIRQLSRDLLRASFTDGQLDRGRVASLVKSLVEKKPRNYLAVLQAYKRLLRLEIDKRTAVIESATELAPEVKGEITNNLKRKYGQDITTEFRITPELLGGIRIRIGSDVWDGSVRHRLQQLEHQF